MDFSNLLVADSTYEFIHTVAICCIVCRLFGGLRNDVLCKAPWYLSDFKDALHPQCLASFFFMYFACLTPIITFGGLLDTATNHNIVSTMKSASTFCSVMFVISSSNWLSGFWSSVCN